MGIPGIVVILACPCMTDDAAQIDWIPGEFEELTQEQAADLLQQHRHGKD